MFVSRKQKYRIGIDAAAASLSRALIGVLIEYKKADKPLRHLFDHMTNSLRHLEDFVVPYVSAAAQSKADEMGLLHLSNYHWVDQAIMEPYAVGKGLRRNELKVFHWEHTQPVGELVRRMHALHNPTAASIEAILKEAGVAWILKEEDDRLTRAGFRTKRADWRECYKQVGIDLLPPLSHDLASP
ncbi:hypothetical protein [Methylorubrum extorquens]|nr:hypothetical protein [Methylorubrum extorquens]